jgi:hypothetical protein
MVGKKKKKSIWDKCATPVRYGVAVLGTWVVADYSNAKNVMKDVGNFLSPSDIKNSEVPPGDVKQLTDKGKYVARKYFEERINTILDREKAEHDYFIIYGSKGCGKSTTVEKCTAGKKGVVRVLISSVSDKPGILKAICAQIMGKDTPAVSEEAMKAALGDAKVGGKLATVIFEIERGKSAEQTACVESVRSLSKLFAGACNCIIVLSEANAILVFGRDNCREEFIFVPDLSHDEGLKLLQAHTDADCDAKEAMRLFESVGTNAAMLMKFIRRRAKGASVDDFITDRLALARQDLVAFGMQPILRALKEHPDKGVKPEYFKNEEYKGIDMSVPVAVGNAMKVSNAVLYDMKEGRYKLISHAHKVALRTYDPMIHGKALATKEAEEKAALATKEAAKKATKEAEEKAALATKEAVEQATKEAEEKAALATKEAAICGGVVVAICGVLLHSVRSQ